MSSLRTYLSDKGEKQSEFASRVGTTPATISRLCDGSLKPSLTLAHRIEAATDGEVRTEAWVADSDDQTEASSGKAGEISPAAVGA